MYLSLNTGYLRRATLTHHAGGASAPREAPGWRWERPLIGGRGVMMMGRRRPNPWTTMPRREGCGTAPGTKNNIETSLPRLFLPYIQSLDLILDDLPLSPDLYGWDEEWDEECGPWCSPLTFSLQ